MKENAVNKITNCLSGIIKATIKNIINKKILINDIKNGVDFFTRNKIDSSYFGIEINKILDKKELKSIAKEIMNEGGYNLDDIFSLRLDPFLKKIKLSDEDSIYFKSCFVGSILAQIKKNNKDIYDKYLLNQIQKTSIAIRDGINDLKEECCKIKTNIKTISEIEQELISTTIRKIGLSFFESDDNNFIFEFEKRISSKELIINVVSQSILEARFIILNELKKYSDKVLAVFDEETWNNLRNNNIRDYILIPFFYSNIIPAIDNNINIYIYNDENPCLSKDKVVIRKRLCKTTIKKLINNGYDDNEAYKMVANTYGLFVPLMNKLYKGKYTIYHDCKDDEAIVAVALLIGGWTEIDRDINYIERLSGITYKQFIATINKYCSGENPLFVKYNKNNIYYAVASREDAWSEFEKNIDDNLWDKFINSIEFIFCENINRSNDVTLENTKKTNEYYCSKFLKEGVLNTLIFLSCFSSKKERIYNAELVIKTIMNNTSTHEEWKNLSDFIVYFVEISPSAVLSKLEEEINNKGEFIELFKNSDYGLQGSYCYCNYLWAIEQLILQENYSYRAIELLFKLNEFDVKYPISNSPQELLNKIFCPWTNVSLIDGENKIRLAEKYLAKYSKSVEIIMSNLPGNNTTIFGELYKPKYRHIDEIKNVNINEYNIVCQRYIELCLNQADKDNKYAEKLIQSTLEFYSEKEYVFDNIEIIINKYSLLDDCRKERLKTFLRDIIYKHRFYVDSDWAASKDIIDCLEVLMNSISFDNKVYDYKYLFTPTYDYPLLAPVPYHNDNFSSISSKNEELIEKEIEIKICNFINDNLSLVDLIGICDINDNTLGYYIFKYFTNKSYDEKTYKLILDNYKNITVVLSYARMIYKTDVLSYRKLVEFSIEQKIDSNLLVDILKISKINLDIIDILVNLEESTKYIFWEHHTHFDIDNDLLPIIINEIEKYGNIRTYINLIFSIKESISLEDMFYLLVKCIPGNFKKVPLDTMCKYYLEQLLVTLRPYVQNDTKKEETMVNVELTFFRDLEWKKMYFLKKGMQINPKIYAQLVSFIFKREDREHLDEEKEIGKKLWPLFYDAKFCPVEKDGKVDENELKQWIIGFKEELKSNGQENLLSNLLGRLFAHSPMEIDDIPLVYPIRNYIEKNYDENLCSSFCAEELNKRGMFTRSGGEEEQRLADKYNDYAKKLRMNYHKCSILFECLSEDYKNLSLREREREEYGY